MTKISEHTWGGIPLSEFKITYQNCRTLLDTYGHMAAVDGGHGHGHELSIVPGVLSIHDHPDSGRPREIHVMVYSPDRVGVGGYQKVAELGPDTERAQEDVAPGYVDFLAKWAGEPDEHRDWKNRIARDNGLAEPYPTGPIMDPRLPRLAREVLDSISATDAIGVWEAASKLADAVLAGYSIHPSYEHALAAPRDRQPGSG